ncbi:MAG: hypothetical protein V4635_04660 [Bacteroidota bacterium]
MLIPTPETAFEPQHNFNPSTIKTKNIKKITFEIIDKKDYEVAVDKNLIEIYEFNTDGLLSRYYYTTIIKTFERQVVSKSRKGRTQIKTFNDYVYDTVSTSYFYSGNNLILKRYHDGMNYYESRYYRYDSLNQLTKEMRYKETNNSPDRSVFILGNQVLLSEDSFQYKKFSSGQVKCVLLNNENRPYKDKITNFDSLGRKINVNEIYTAAAWIMQENKYEYAGKKFVSAQFEGNANNKVILRNVYEYDDKDELYAEKQFKNETLVKEISYVTDKNDSLLNSIIIRDPANKTIRIVRLRYDTGAVSKSDR